MPHIVIRSAQWAALSAHAVKLLCDLLAQYNGHNNGDLCLTWNMMLARGWKSRDTLDKARRELLTHGWIAQTAQGGLHRPSLYGLTMFALDDSAKLDVNSATFPRGAWCRIAPEKNANANTPGVSVSTDSTRRPCQLPPSHGADDTPGVRVTPSLGDLMTRSACTSIDLPSPVAAATPRLRTTTATADTTTATADTTTANPKHRNRQPAAGNTCPAAKLSAVGRERTQPG